MSILTQSVRPKKRAFLNVAAGIMLLSVINACSKSSTGTPATGSKDPNPKVNPLSVLSYHAGDTVLLTGQNLGTDPSKLKVQLNDTLTLTVYQAKDSLVSVILPVASRLNYYGVHSFELEFILNGSMYYTNTFNLTIGCPEPKGWFVQAAMDHFRNDVGQLNIYFPSDSIGYLHTTSIIAKTRDGGNTWGSLGDSRYGSPITVAVSDTANIWSLGIGNYLGYTTNGGDLWGGTTLPAALTNDIIRSAYMAGPTSGLLITSRGQAYKISGGFDTTQNILAEYRTQYAVRNTNSWNDLSAMDVDNALIGGQTQDTTVFPAAQRSLIVTKNNGNYDEYLLPASVSTSGIRVVQLVDYSLGYAIDGTSSLLKYTGNRTWTVLSQKADAMYFTSPSEGIVAYDGKIWQTTDGGQAWNAVFNLPSGDVVSDFTVHNGKIWGMGNNTSTNAGFIIKYNP